MHARLKMLVLPKRPSCRIMENKRENDLSQEVLRKEQTSKTGVEQIDFSRCLKTPMAKEGLVSCKSKVQRIWYEF